MNGTSILSIGGSSEKQERGKDGQRGEKRVLLLKTTGELRSGPKAKTRNYPPRAIPICNKERIMGAIFTAALETQTKPEKSSKRPTGGQRNATEKGGGKCRGKKRAFYKQSKIGNLNDRSERKLHHRVESRGGRAQPMENTDGEKISEDTFFKTLG